MPAAARNAGSPPPITTAQKLGLRIGMAASKAQAMVADLLMVDADPVAEDAAALERLALWTLRQYSPIVAVDGADGHRRSIRREPITCDGGEALLDVGSRQSCLRGRGLTARVALADTWGAAHALARLLAAETTVVPVDNVTKAVIDLPIAALRLPPEIVQGLRVLGIDTVGQLSAMPRAPLTLRFGPEPGTSPRSDIRPHRRTDRADPHAGTRLRSRRILPRADRRCPRPSPNMSAGWSARLYGANWRKTALASRRC
jgi:hypothetical protein